MGGAIDGREQEKYSKYDQLIQEERILFLPLVVEVIGGWNGKGLKLLEELSRRHADYHFIEKKVALRRIMTGLSVRLQQANERMLPSRMFILPQ